MDRTSVPEGKEGVNDRNSECAVKMCEILYLLDSETEPRLGLSQIPLYSVIMHSRDSLVQLCCLQGQRSVQ